MASSFHVHDGDFRQWDPGTFDICLTDPPYLREHLPLFGDLGAWCMRHLNRPHGRLVTMISEYHLDTILDELRAGGLEYRTILSQPSANGWGLARLWPTRVLQGFRLWLVMQPPDCHLRDGGWDGFRYNVLPAGPPRKDGHPWQQAVEPFATVLERFTDPGWTVVDPFTGTGTTGVACKLVGRTFMGAEIDPDLAQRARDRIGTEAVQPTLGDLI